jgi:hypothetical protein
VNASRCSSPVTLEQLLAYLLDEISSEAQASIDEHLLGCDVCGQLFDETVAMADAVRTIVGTGGVDAVLTSRFLQRLERSGVRIREYELAPNSQVRCTITPDDDLVAARLHAPLDGVGRLDVLIHNPGTHTPDRLEDVPFDPTAGEVVLAPQSAALRSLGAGVQRVELVAVEGGSDRMLGAYIFDHHPFSGKEGR